MQNAFDHYPVLMAVGIGAVALIIVSVTISAIGGWMTLAKKYRHCGEFKGEQWGSQSGDMRFIAGYRNGLNLGVNEKGLYLSTILPFRIAHPPLFIPWTEVSVEWKKTASSWPGVKLILDRESNVPLWINEKLAVELKRTAGNSWPESF